jgi:hypothetical protein
MGVKKSSSVSINQGRTGWRTNRVLVVFCWQALRHTFEKPPGKQKTEEGCITSRKLVGQVLDLIALHGLWAQAHSRPWVILGWVRRYRWYSERASCFMSATYSSKGIICPYKPLIGIDLMHSPDSRQTASRQHLPSN